MTIHTASLVDSHGARVGHSHDFAGGSIEARSGRPVDRCIECHKSVGEVLREALGAADGTVATARVVKDSGTGEWIARGRNAAGVVVAEGFEASREDAEDTARAMLAHAAREN